MFDPKAVHFETDTNCNPSKLFDVYENNK